MAPLLNAVWWKECVQARYANPPSCNLHAQPLYILYFKIHLNATMTVAAEVCTTKIQQSIIRGKKDLSLGAGI